MRIEKHRLYRRRNRCALLDIVAGPGLMYMLTYMSVLTDWTNLLHYSFYAKYTIDICFLQILYSLLISRYMRTCFSLIGKLSIKYQHFGNNTFSYWCWSRTIVSALQLRCYSKTLVDSKWLLVKIWLTIALHHPFSTHFDYTFLLVSHQWYQRFHLLQQHNT